VLTVVAVVILAVAFALNGFKLDATTPGPDQSVPEAGYRFINRLNLADLPAGENAIYLFTLDAPREVDLMVRFESPRAELLNLRLTGPDGLDLPLFHAEGYYASADQSSLSETLPAGEYRLLLETRAASGVLLLYESGQ
jgi:hypothetical protein